MSQARNVAKMAQSVNSTGVLDSAAVQGGGGGGGGSGPKISAIIVTDSNYTNLDDTAVDVGGGYIKLIGTEFTSGCQVLINNTPATSTTFVSSTEVRAQVPATTAGTYIVYLVNSDGGVAIRVNGITFSTTPTWTTASNISGELNSVISIPLVASGATVYSLASGSTLPSGLSLSSGGLLSGNTNGLTEGATYSFTILASDAELQDSPRTFALNISLIRDPHFRNTSLLLSANGTNNAQNNTFIDSSSNNYALTRAGNTAQGTFSPYGPNWSNSFATNTVLQYPAISSLRDWWTQDFTIEMWVCNNTNAGSTNNNVPLQIAHGTYNSDATYWAFGTNSDGRVLFYYYNGSTNYIATPLAPYKVEVGKWCHIAMVYTNSTGNITLFLNGMPLVSATKSGTPQSSSSNTINIGAAQSTYYNGLISNLRIVSGTALYTSAFTPSTSPLTAVTNTQLLTCQSNIFKDSSPNNAVPTLIGSPSIQRFSPFAPVSSYSTSTIGGSAYFDGSDSLSAAYTGDPTGNFTIEFWWYPTTLAPNYQEVFTKSTGIQVFTISSTINAAFSSNNSTSYYLNGSFGTLIVNSWNHIVVVKNGTSYTGYLNGIGTSLGTSSDVPATGGNPVSIGYYAPTNTYYTAGYLSDVRYVVGTAVYVSNFTPPTVPLTAIANTQLLCNFTNAGIVDAAMQNNLETVGDAKISTAQAKFGTSSMYFDGTGDYLRIQANPTLNFSTGDFTIECWSYLISRVSSYPTIFSNYNAYTSGSLALFAGHSSGSTTQYQVAFNGSGFPNINGGTVQYSTWTHLAVVCESGILRLYVNGTRVGTTIPTNGAPINMVDSYFYIGTSGDDFVNTPINGYIDDFRVTKGIARYTADFTPPTVTHAIQ